MVRAGLRREVASPDTASTVSPAASTRGHLPAAVRSRLPLRADLHRPAGLRPGHWPAPRTRPGASGGAATQACSHVHDGVLQCRAAEHAALRSSIAGAPVSVVLVSASQCSSCRLGLGRPGLRRRWPEPGPVIGPADQCGAGSARSSSGRNANWRNGPVWKNTGPYRSVPSTMLPAEATVSPSRSGPAPDRIAARWQAPGSARLAARRARVGAAPGNGRPGSCCPRSAARTFHRVRAA